MPWSGWNSKKRDNERGEGRLELGGGSASGRRVPPKSGLKAGWALDRALDRLQSGTSLGRTCLGRTLSSLYRRGLEIMPVATRARKRGVAETDDVRKGQRLHPAKASKASKHTLLPNTRKRQSIRCPAGTGMSLTNADVSDDNPKPTKVKLINAEEKANEKHHVLLTNRAPVLTLWVAVVSERQGYTFEEGLTFGRWVAGILAQSKGRSLGIYSPKEKTDEMVRARQHKEAEMGVHRVEAFGMQIPVVGNPGGQLRAVSDEKYTQTISPLQSESYLSRSLGKDGYQDCRKAMMALAEAIPREDIGKQAYSLYEQFRPEWRGWGEKGHLDLDGIYSMAASLS